VWLTGRARALREPATAAAEAQNVAALAGLSPEEREIFLALMNRVIANMRAR
jgi:DNA-binding MarR family transcriptional regulator